MVESSPLNYWEKRFWKNGRDHRRHSDMYVHEVKNALGLDFDILSLAFTNPLPSGMITEFYNSIDGDVYVIEDGYRFIQEACSKPDFIPLGKKNTAPSPNGLQP
jgi:indolepyruvate ferredoxin oxidoreductase alpha subunit